MIPMINLQGRNRDAGIENRRGHSRVKRGWDELRQ